MEFIYTITTPLLSYLTLGLNIFSLFLIIGIIFRKSSLGIFVQNKIGKYSLLMGLVVALGSLVGSVVYSNIIGFDPCSLCWWERILIYPQIVIFTVGLILKDKNSLVYSMVFSIATILLSGYHTIIQLFPGVGSSCSGIGVSCTKVYFLYFGYITIPTMALSAGVFFFLVAVLFKRFNLNKN